MVTCGASIQDEENVYLIAIYNCKKDIVKSEAITDKIATTYYAQHFVMKLANSNIKIVRKNNKHAFPDSSRF